MSEKKMDTINLDCGNGTASGYVVGGNEEQLGNYLSDNTDVYAEIADWVRDNCEEIAILKNINVDYSARGKGVGVMLLTDFLNEAIEAQAIFLIADTMETNQFDLVDWYKKNDFVQVAEGCCGPVLCYPSEVAELLNTHLSSLVNITADSATDSIDPPRI
jgi:hypothetical protein